MPRKRTPSNVAAEIRSILKRHGSPEHAPGVGWFFKEEIRSHGWRTADLRRLARQHRRALHKEHGLDFMVSVADSLFTGRVLEEKVFAVLLLENLPSLCDDTHFALFESWLDRISSWADHDGLVHYLIGPMIKARPGRARKVFEWAKSPDRWHRRAACVALIQGTRRKMFFPHIVRLSNLLLEDQDDMVQKGLGWLLRETAKADRPRTVPYLRKIRSRAPRRVLRTASETLPRKTRSGILGSSPVHSRNRA
jgi:3-methyladenine DNA glycosylase AlkD